MNTIFDCEDLLENILYKLPYYYVSALCPVNKQFHRVGSRIYRHKWKSDVHDVSVQAIEKVESFLVGKRINRFGTLNAIELFNQYLEKMQIENLWPILVHDLEFLERFILCSNRFKYYFIFGENHLVEINEAFGTWEKRFQFVRKYLFIDNPMKFTVNELRIFASLKGIKGNHKMNRSQLKQRLKRNPNKMYSL